MNRRTRSAVNFFAVFTLPAIWWGGIVLVSLGAMASMSLWTQEFPTYKPDFQFGNFVRDLRQQPVPLCALAHLQDLAAGVPVLLPDRLSAGLLHRVQGQGASP